MPLQPRDRLGPYEIQALLGVGGMGEVYRGRDTRLGRDVALKVISPGKVGDAEHRRRFELEARAASVLNHPSIVTIYDVGETEGVSWIAMEWVSDIANSIRSSRSFGETNPSATVRMSDRRLSPTTSKCRLMSSAVSRSIRPRVGRAWHRS